MLKRAKKQNKGWLQHWWVRTIFLLLASLILFGLFSAPPIKLIGPLMDYGMSPTPVGTRMMEKPTQDPKSATLTAAQQLVVEEHKKAVDEIKMRIEQEDGWFRYKFLLVGGLLLAFLAHIIRPRRDKDSDPESRLENLLRSNATCLVLALALVVAVTIDIHDDLYIAVFR